MSQNDFVIANASGSSVRSDMNSAFQALASLSSGTSAPSTTYANQLWHDETNDLLKMRDEANTAWITIASKVTTTWTPYWQGTAQGNMSTLTYSAVAQALIMSAKQIETAKATVASATTPNLSTAAANAIEITGTTTITGWTLGQAGTLYFIYYTGSGLTLQHNATSNILPGAANISVATGDTFFVLSMGSNNARIFGYQRASGAALVGAAATQAEMEAASSTAAFSTPGRQHNHPGHAKAWVHYKMTTTSAIQSDYGVTSRTDDGTGLATFTFDTAFASTAAYTAAGAWSRDDGTSFNGCSGTSTGTKTTTTFQIACTTDAGANEDSPEVGVTWMGDQ